MQVPEEDDDGRVSAEGAAGSPNVPEGAVGPGDQDTAKEESPAAEGAPPVEGASQDSGMASAFHSHLGGQLSEFTLTVPFLSYVDAEVARRYLMAGAETYHGRVHWDLTVADCDLFIRLTSEDADLLQISTASLLHRLSIVVQTMQHFVPQFCSKGQSQKGA